MKPQKFLLTSLLAAAAMSAVPAFAVTTTTTTLDDVTYSGTIWTTTVSGASANLSANTRSYSDGTNSYAGNAGITGVGKFYNYFFDASETQYVGNTLRLTGATQNHTVTTDWSNYAWFGGLITDACNFTYTIGRSNTAIRLKGTAGVNMSINADTVIWGDKNNTPDTSGISVESDGSWVIATNKTLKLKSTTSATFAAGTTTTVSGGGTLSFTECAKVVLNGSLSVGTDTALDFSSSAVEVGGQNTFFNASQTGAQNFSGVQFVIATGDGSVSGLTAGSIRVNGVTYANTTIAEDNKSGTVSGSVYNIALGDSASISDVSSAGTFDYVNVFGTLTGFGASAFSSPVTGSGTVEFSSLSSKTIRLANWTGTVVFKNISDVNNVGLTLSDYGSKIRFDDLEGRVTTTGSSGLWFNSGTVNADIEIASGGLKVTNGTTNITTTFAGKLTGTGTFEYTRAINQTFKFTGNFSEFTGTLKSSDVATGFFELANTGDMTFNGNFDNANFRKSAPGVLTIANAGTFKNIEQNGGGLKFSGSGTTTIGLFKTTGSTNNVVTIDSGATLDVTTWNQAYTISTLTVNGDLNVSGVMTLATGSQTNNITGTGNLTVGTLTTSNLGTYVFSGVNLKIGSGGITGTQPLRFGQMIIGVKDGVTSWTAARGFTLTAASGTTFCPTEKAQSINLQGVIDGTGKLVKSGAGTLTLSNANTYEGGTTIEGGRLVAANEGALGSGTTKVESGAELGLVAETAVTVTNGINLASGAKLVVDMTGVVAGTEEVIVLTLVSETALNYNGTGSFDTTGMLGSVVVLENLSGTLSAWTQSLSYADNTLQLTLTIPEPSAFGLLAGLGALALAGTRRRRKKA